MVRQGWQCPCCQVIWNPDVKSCLCQRGLKIGPTQFPFQSGQIVGQTAAQQAAIGASLQNSQKYWAEGEELARGTE